MFLLLPLILAVLVRAQGPIQTLFPAAIPLAIRSPYLSAWQNTTIGSSPLGSAWPLFWTESAILGWQGIVRIDGVSYSWMGNDSAVQQNVSKITNIQFTPTRTIYFMTAGPLNLTVTFLSPIEPADLVKQSMPLSYLAVEASSLDGQPHSVQLYSDISAEWVSGDRTASVKWSTSPQNTGTSLVHQIQLQSPTRFTENSDQAEDSTVYYGIAFSPTGLTWQIDVDKTMRPHFVSQGSLSNTGSTNFGPINNPFYVFGLAMDLGMIQSTSEPVTWSIGVMRDPSVTFTMPSGSIETRRPYYMSRFSSVGSAVDSFITDFSNANERAIALDEKIMSAAANVSSNYVDLLSLTARQAMGAMDITILSTFNNSVDASDVKVFMKNIGASSRVNAVERLYEAMPAFLYFNASILSGLLEPLLLSQDLLSGQPYCLQDIGDSYPSATSSRLGLFPEFGIDQTASMLIMMYAYARISGDGTQTAKHYDLAKRWTDYLVDGTSPMPNLGIQALQDNATSKENNSPNLALKSIIAIGAMAEMSRVNGNDSDAQLYGSKASSLIGQWQSLALSSDQKNILATFGVEDSWSLTYNLYADLLLGTGLVPQSVFNILTNSLRTQVSTAPAFGLPIDSTTGVYSSTAWTLFAAASVTDTNVRDQLIRGVWNRANSSKTVGAFLDYYSNTDGSAQLYGGPAGPSLGAMFAPLALMLPNKTIGLSVSGNQNGTSGTNPDPNASNSDDKSSKPTGAIVGGVVGGVMALAIAAASVWFFRGRSRRSFPRGAVDMAEEPHAAPYGFPYTDDPSVSAPDLSSSSGSGQNSSVNPVYRPHGSASDGNWNNPGATAHSSALQPLPLTKAQQAGIAPLLPRISEISSSVEGRASSNDLSRGVRRDSLASSAAATALTASVSPTELVVGLRQEVQDLRRAMQQLQVERIEAPPQYDG